MVGFLTFISSFNWNEFDLDRNETIENLNSAILLANEYKDNMYYHSLFFSKGTPSLDLFTFLWENDFECFKIVFPWIEEPQYQALTHMPNYFKHHDSAIPDLHTLSQLLAVPTSWLGFKSLCQEQLVYNETTWRDFHYQIVKTFNRSQRQQEKDYFIEFFKPLPLIDTNQISSLILHQKADPLFDRIDVPSKSSTGNNLHGEQIHVHFNDDKRSALNIDGTWKHGSFELPNAVCNFLILWGFILPENKI